MKFLSVSLFSFVACKTFRGTLTITNKIYQLSHKDKSKGTFFDFKEEFEDTVSLTTQDVTNPADSRQQMSDTSSGFFSVRSQE